jgi:N-acetylglucosaminyldiphosphoundecaprenol N-acetyl-beta-D-mannosaminyltransferase
MSGRIMSEHSKVFGLAFSSMTRAELVANATGAPIVKGAGPRSIYTANLDHIVQLRRNVRLRGAYSQAWAVTADGMPVFLYAKARGAGVPARVTGSDLFGDILSSVIAEKHRCFLVASAGETAKLLVDWLVTRGFDRSSIDYDVPPTGFENNILYSANLASRIRTHGTTHLFFGVGAPKSEIWINDYRAELGDCYVLSAGSGLDFFVGTKKRAPRSLQRIGFEWLWRFSTEPRRLFRRYFIDSWSFVAAISEDIRHRGSSTS